MALDAALRAVLARDGTASAALTRAFVAGLRAGLADLAPDDPGAADLAAELATVLEARKTSPPTVEPKPGQTTSGLQRDLFDLAERVAPGSASPVDDAGALWTAVHLKALRLPRREADTARRLAEEAAVRAKATAGRPLAAATVPGPKDERLIPLLKIDGRAVVSGLAVSTARPPKSAGTVPPALEAFTGLILALAELDPGLHHCLQAVEFSGLRGLADPAARSVYAQHLTGRLREVADQSAHTGAWLEAVVRLHEALCSVVHLPPASGDSWWGEWRGACNEALSDAAYDSGAGTVKFPPDRYRSADDLTRHDIAIRFPPRAGLVLACVRAWSSVGGVETPGRVIYAT